MKLLTFGVGAALLVALAAVPVAASDYMGWYLGPGIGYGYPMAAAPNSACTDKGGKIINHKSKVFCTKPINSEQGPAASQTSTGAASPNSTPAMAQTSFLYRHVLPEIGCLSALPVTEKCVSGALASSASLQSCLSGAGNLSVGKTAICWVPVGGTLPKNSGGKRDYTSGDIRMIVGCLGKKGTVMLRNGVWVCLVTRPDIANSDFTLGHLNDGS